AAAAAPHVFTPRAAARGGSGLILSYYLPQKARQVKVTIRDANGRVVNTYTSRAPGHHAAAPANFFRRGPAAPAVKAGINQFIWNLRYPGATTFKGMVLWGANLTSGPEAVPGSYRAELSVDGGAPQTVSFQVLSNPHSPATMADLKAQFDLDEQVVADETRANQAVIDVRALRRQVEQRIAHNADLKGDGATLTAQLTGIEHTIYQTKSHASEDPLNFPIKLNNRIGHLMGVIEGSYDARPTDQTYAVFHALDAELNQVLVHFQRIQSGPLAAFNRKLAAAGAAPVALQAGVTK
ncbi:MAG: hypothetical protein ACRD0Y_10485, partial [Terriglobales bacterium]